MVRSTLFQILKFLPNETSKFKPLSNFSNYALKFHHRTFLTITIGSSEFHWPDTKHQRWKIWSNERMLRTKQQCMLLLSSKFSFNSNVPVSLSFNFLVRSFDFTFALIIFLFSVHSLCHWVFFAHFYFRGRHCTPFQHSFFIFSERQRDKREREWNRESENEK